MLSDCFAVLANRICAMSEYERMSVKGLRSLLQQRGLYTKGCKNDLIERLLEYDGEIVLMANQASDHDNNVQVNGDVAQHDDCADMSRESQESEAVKILRLQIELEKIKLQQSQVGMAVGRDNSSVAGEKFDLAAIKSRLPVMSVDCDVIAYFMMYEKTMELNEVPRELWASFLPSVLNERAGKIFSQQPMECCRDYEKSRALLINAFKCSSDVYLRKLQTSIRTGNESYTMFLNRLAEYHVFYLQSRKIVDFDSLKDDVLMNFFMMSLRENVVEFVKSRQPKNAREAAAAADLYYSVKSRPLAQERAAHLFRGQNQCVKLQRAGKPAETFGAAADEVPTAASIPAAKNPSKGDSKLKACWSCGSLAHRRADCPAFVKPSSTNGKRNAKAETSAFVASHSHRNADERFIFPCYVKGREGMPFKAYRDSGASVSLFSKSIVDDRAYTGETISVRGIFGPEVQIPMAIVRIKSPKFSFDGYVELKAGVVDTELPFHVDALIGNDLFGNCVDVLCVNDCHLVNPAVVQPTINSTLNRSNVVNENAVNETSDSAVLLTSADDVHQVSSQARVHALSEGTDNSNSDLIARGVKSAENTVPWYGSFDTDCVASDSCDEEFLRLSAIDPSLLNPLFSTTNTPKQMAFIKAQQSDPKLKSALIKAEVGKSGFVLKNGMLFKRKPKHIRSENEFLLVLPDCYKARVLKAAHDSVEAGCHLGYRTTCAKILRVFHMPRSEIKAYTTSCITCQRLKPKCINERAAKLIPALTSDFGRRWIIDIVGPKMPHLSRSYGNHEYILVCICDSTRWVELIPLPSLKARTLADAVLSNLVARYRCTTLIYDQQSAFMSDLMQEALKLLRVNSDIAVAGFHAKTAICERYIRTVETILKAYIFSYKGKWHTLLPWIAFQLRQTPCATLGFSAHELTFGKNFPDTLDHIKADFIDQVNKEEKKVKRDVISYINDLREKIRVNQQMSKEHALASHTKTKVWFDKHCMQNKSFDPGDKVLILEPTDTRKMYACWSEPKSIARKIDDRNYEVFVDEQRKVKTFHVNQLRKFNERTEFINMVIVSVDPKTNAEDDHILSIDDEQTEGPSKFHIEPTLPVDERNALLAVLTEFEDVFRPSLGKTDLATHCIELTDNKPCVKPMYRLPESLKRPFEEEVQRLLQAGVLRECQSAYRSPVIAIKKADGTSLRLVNNYKLLNDKTVDDLYPISNPREIIS